MLGNAIAVKAGSSIVDGSPSLCGDNSSRGVEDEGVAEGALARVRYLLQGLVEGSRHSQRGQKQL